MIKKEKALKWAAAALIVGAAGIFACTKFLGGEPDAAVLADTSISTSPVIRGTIRSTVTGTGSIATAREQELTSPGAATLLEANVEDGDIVQKGDILFVVDCPAVESAQQAVNQYQYQLEEYYEARDELIKYAENQYQVLTVEVTEGEKVSKNTVLMTLLDIQTMTLQVPAAEGANWQKGQSLDIEFIEYGDKIRGTLASEGTKSTSNGKEYLTFELELESGQRLTGETYALAVNNSFGNQAAVLLKPRSEISIKAPADGTLIQLGVKEGETLSAGTLLYEMESSTLESQISEANAEMQEQQAALKEKSTTITAEFDGIYYAAADSTGPMNTFLEVGDSLDSGESLGKVVDSSRMQIVFDVDELDIGKVEVGQSVSVVADALPEVTYEGTVARIAQEGNSSGNVSYYWVVIEIPDWEGLKVGMTSSIEIIAQEAENALLVPINAVHTLRDISYVILAEDQSTSLPDAPAEVPGEEESPEDEGTSPAAEEKPAADRQGEPVEDSGAEEGDADTAGPGEDTADKGETAEDISGLLPERAVIVETGIISDDYVEILSGLSEGQVVEVAGQVSAREDSGQMMMTMSGPGGMGGAPGGGMGGGPGGMR